MKGILAGPEKDYIGNAGTDYVEDFIFHPDMPFMDIEMYVEPQIEIAVFTLDSIAEEFYDLSDENIMRNGSVRRLVQMMETASNVLKNASRIIPIIRKNYAEAEMAATKLKGQ